MLVLLLTMIFVVALMIGLNALYVAGEFAAVSARKSRIIQSANEGNRLAKMMLPVLEDHHRLDNYIAASQVGITLSSIILGIYGQRQIAPMLDPLLLNLPFIDSEIAAAGLSSLIVLIVLTALQVVLGELVPKSLAIQYPEQVALSTVLPMRWSADFLLRPLIVLLNGSGTILLRLLGSTHEAGHKHVHSPEEIMLLIEQSHEGGVLDENEKVLLDNALRMGELTVGDIVIPRTRMVAASIQTSLYDLVKLAAASDYTRIPIYENDIDHILGFVHLKDLFRLYHNKQPADIKSIIRKATFVPETTSVNEAWNVMNKERSYLAFVFDEYGGTIGMITREDLIEEIFGEVQDEFDEEMPLISKSSEGKYMVHGEVPIAQVNNELGLGFSTEEAHTINGLIINKLGRIPEVNDKITIDKVEFLVQSIQGKTADKVLLTLQIAIDDEDEA